MKMDPGKIMQWRFQAELAWGPCFMSIVMKFGGSVWSCPRKNVREWYSWFVGSIREPFDFYSALKKRVEDIG
jgi:hypothetical protein